MATTTFNVRMDSDLKREVDEVARNIGLSTAAAVNIFARQFVAHRGFPFPVVEPVLSERDFSHEMDKRFRAMKEGDSAEEDIF